MSRLAFFLIFALTSSSTVALADEVIAEVEGGQEDQVAVCDAVREKSASGEVLSIQELDIFRECSPQFEIMPFDGSGHLWLRAEDGHSFFDYMVDFGAEPEGGV